MTERAIKQGLQQAHLSGRFQFIQSSPAVLLDVGHNPQAAYTLQQHLQHNFQSTAIHAVFTMMNDKDIHAVIKLMQAPIKHWYIAPLDNPRNSEESQLQQAFTDCHIHDISLGFKDFMSALQAAKIAAQADNGLVLIFGSFFLVAEYLRIFSHSTHHTAAE